jgi:hypothetical protein
LGASDRADSFPRQALDRRARLAFQSVREPGWVDHALKRTAKLPALLRDIVARSDHVDSGHEFEASVATLRHPTSSQVFRATSP